ncbi:MAG: CZB domain-containing protein [Pseudomonadota bacterium]
MSILSWLRSVTQGSDDVADTIALQPMQFAAGEEEFRGLNMKQALDAHIAWTRRVENHLKGSDDSRYEVAEVAADHLCTLGKWIHGPAQREFGPTAEYAELRRVHADFHIAVGAVLNDVDNGTVTDAEQSLKKVRHKSGEVQLALIRLYAAARSAGMH